MITVQGMMASLVPLQSSVFEGSATYIVSQLLNGLMLGMILVLVTLGLSLIFGFGRVLNFAHGDLITVGAYSSWVVISATGSYLLGLVAAFIVTGIVGGVFERTLLRRIYGEASILQQLLLTFGFGIFLRGVVVAIWGSSAKNLPRPPWASEAIYVAGITIPTYRLAVIVAALLVIVLLYLFITQTDLGLIIRAGVEDREMVRALGINVSLPFLIVFVIGVGVAAIAGALVAPIQGVYPQIGVEYLIMTFVVVVVGGMGSFKGSIVAGLLIGVLIVFTGVIYPQGSQVLPFVFMAGVILVRPEGLFGET